MAGYHIQWIGILRNMDSLNVTALPRKRSKEGRHNAHHQRAEQHLPMHRLGLRHHL